MAWYDFDVDDSMRKAYRDVILQTDSERQKVPADSEAYKALSTVIETCQKRLAGLQYKEPR